MCLFSDIDALIYTDRTCLNTWLRNFSNTLYAMHSVRDC